MRPDKTFSVCLNLTYIRISTAVDLSGAPVRTRWSNKKVEAILGLVFCSLLGEGQTINRIEMGVKGTIDELVLELNTQYIYAAWALLLRTLVRIHRAPIRGSSW
jgi:hypothetical protein